MPRTSGYTIVKKAAVGWRKNDMTNKSSRIINNIGAVIPVYEPGELFQEALKSLLGQTRAVCRLLIIDSTPPDKEPTPKVQVKTLTCDHVMTEYVRILPEKFDHGGTRNFGAKHLMESGEVDAVLFLTQDAIMAQDCLERLVAFMEGNDLAATFARQLPRKRAGEIEIAERLKGYPTKSWISKGKPQRIDNVFFSDVCSLVRLDAFTESHGFPDRIITAEDMILAIRLLEHGFRIGYCAEAKVEHSHALSLWRLVKRYFDIGVMHADWKGQVPVKTAGNRGASLVVYQARYLLRRKPLGLGRLVLNVAAKYFGYQLGRHYQSIPVRLRQNFSQNRQYWFRDKTQ